MKTCKKLLLIILIFSNQLAFSQENNEKITIVKTYLEAAFNENIAKQRSLMSENIIDYHPTVLARPAKGIEELLMGWNNTMQPMDSVNYERTGTGMVTLEDGEFTGDWVLETGLVHMKVTGSDGWIKTQMVGLYKIEQGKIIEVRNFGNMMDLYQQMGYTLTAPDK